MNLVLSGPIGDDLRNVVIGLSRPRHVVRLHARAYRLEGADDSAAMRAQVAELCDAARVDHAYVEEGRRFSDFKLLAMDMDSTLITIECIDEIADFAGKKQEVAAITEAAMRGEITDFAESLRRRVALLAGTKADVLRRVYEERLALSEGATELLSKAKSEGIYTLLVSGGFTYFADKLKTELALDEAHSNTLEITGGLLTGKILGAILGPKEKALNVRTALRRLKLRKGQGIALGDGANDVLMFREVTYSVAFHAKQAAAAAARVRVKYGSLAAINDFFSV